MKILAAYTVFNGLELINASIRQIRPYVDDVVICAQTSSNNGTKMIQDDVDILMKLDHKLITYYPRVGINAKQNERDKHQLIVDHAKRNGFTHLILFATDHFYIGKEIERAIEIYKQNPVDITATRMYTYYKHPTWRLTPIEDYVFPFICRIYPDTVVRQNVSYPWITDPSVRISPANSFYLYDRSEIMLHHFSMVRKDIRHKFNNAAARQNWTNERLNHFIHEFDNYDIKENPGVSYFRGRSVEIVKNEFKLKI